MGAINDAVHWLFSDAITVATIIYAALTYSLLRQTIRLRQVETDPEISIYLEAGHSSQPLISLVIGNIGRGPAYDVRFTVSPDDPIWENHDWRLTKITFLRNDEGLPYMAPGQMIRVDIGTFMSLRKTPFSISASYLSKAQHRSKRRSSRPFASSFTLSVGKFEGMALPQETPEQQIANHLKKIAAEVGEITDGSSSLKMSIESIYRRPRRRRYMEEPLRWSELTLGEAVERAKGMPKLWVSHARKARQK